MRRDGFILTWSRWALLAAMAMLGVVLMHHDRVGMLHLWLAVKRAGNS